MTIEIAQLTHERIPAAIGTVVQRIAGGETFAIAFGGQGANWLAAAKNLLRDFELRSDLDRVLNLANDLLAPVADELAFCGDFAAADWISEQRAPHSAAASMPGIVLTQLGGLRALERQGVDIVAHQPQAVIAHSQGVLAAHVVRGVRAAEAVAQARIIGAAADRVAREHGLTGAANSPVMLAVTQASGSELETIAADFPRLSLQVRNGFRAFVVSGPTRDLAAFRAACAARSHEERAQIEAKQRGGQPFDPQFEALDAPVAFHHFELQPAIELAVDWAERAGLDSALTREMATAALTAPVDWVADVNAAVATGARWIFDLGPADLAARMTRSIAQGRAVGTIATTTEAGHRALTITGATPEIERPWNHFAPRLVHLPDGTLKVETAFTRATGKSPILLAGMTPTTVDAGIVAAAANAGFWAELAGGGQVTEDIFQARIAELDELLEPGRSYAFNSLLLDPYLWKLQLGGRKLVQKARAAGAPIDAVVVTAGIPELDDAVALIRELRELGVSHIVFKPGTVAQINQTLAIAEAVPEETIMVQVEGGKAGGHHSWEDLDELLLATYAKIRARDNTILCVGGGIGTPQRAADYLLGRWSQQHGFPQMPVDGILVGTAAMATLEATTAPDVKQALVAATGTPDWVGAGNAVGGIASGRSQLGADIHEIDNAASQCGRLLDEVAGDAAAVQARSAEIIAALNATAKPYFGAVESMTYAELLDRYLELTYEPWQSWIDESWAERFRLLLQRAEARLHERDHGEIDTLFASYDDVADGPAAAHLLALRYPEATSTVLHPGDRSYFLEVCSLAGKPVNFVPVLDGDVRRWWRSDSLWQAHDAHYSADQVCIIPGPVSVAGIERADEPIAELLQRFEDTVIDELHVNGGGTRNVPARRYIADAAPAVARALAATDVVWAGRTVTNPVHRLGAPKEWNIEAGAARHEATGAALTDEGDTAVLTVPLTAEDALQLRLTSSAADANPLVENAVEAMRALLQITSGGLTTPVRDNQVVHEVTLDPVHAIDHGALTAAALPAGLQAGAAIPDALVGYCWPAIFSLIGAARTAEGTTVAEGLLDLVHLDHTSANTADVTQLTGTAQVAAELLSVTETEIGRVVSIHVTVTQGETQLAAFTERFAIRNRRGTAAAPEPLAIAPEAQRVERKTLRTATLKIPAVMRSFAAVSGDHNPIHTNLAAARLAGLGEPIAHGMFVSAAAQHVVTASGANETGAPAQISAWNVQFLAPVLPGAEVDIAVHRTGVVDGALLADVTGKVGDDLVFRATAQLSAPRTVYAFPGQGIQHVGMGMAGYQRSDAAREVWDRADAHTRAVLGFSILTVVRDNPTTVIANGVRHHHPDGVLFLTQFTQVAMATLGAAQTAELRERGVFVDDAYLCGHSVGEYNALAAVSGVLSLEAVVEIVFQRGSVMHTLVPRDADGRSNYRLAAIRPSQLGLSDDEVAPFVARVSETSGEFLQIVNYNLRGSQYAIAGTVRGLEVLEQEVEKLRNAFGGKASFILVPGIDVPFHSSVLHGGVPEFRGTLAKLLPAEIDPEILTGRYIPNLVPRLFSLDREFVQEIADLVPSEPLNEILADFDAWAERPGELCREVLIELLAWQFASPVRWIETQDLIFSELQVDRFIEVGVANAPTIANLAAATLKIPGLAWHLPDVVNIERDAAVAFYTDADPQPAEDEQVTEEVSAPEQPAAAAAPTASAAPPTSSERPADLSFTAADASRTLLALATKMRPEQLEQSDSIESLCDGVSSRRNQILLDLGTELDLGAIDGAAEAELAALDATVNTLAPRYRPFGPVLDDAITDLLRRALGPSGAKPAAIADRVTNTWQLESGWVQWVRVAFALQARDGASVRGGELGAGVPDDVDAAIDAAVHNVAAVHGLTVSLPAAAADAVVDSAALQQFADDITGPRGVLASAARLVLNQLGHNEPTAATDVAIDDGLAETVGNELGSDWQRTVAPAFDAKRTVVLDDRWASAREDLASIWIGRETGPFDAAGEIVAQQARWWATRAEREGRHDLVERYIAAAKAAQSEEAGLWSDDVAVVTGASNGSIAAEIVAQLLSGGARVIATTSSINTTKLRFFKELYRRHARGGAWLHVVPANMASFADVDALAEWVHTELDVTPTLLFPFAAPQVLGDLSDAGARNETQMRVLLWSVERLLGNLAEHGASTADLDPARLHVVLPGSPNRGTFGGDGAYGEAKAALDAIVAKWSAERHWTQQVSLVHALIGWVRGTGLMGGNDGLVAAVEDAGVRTWSPSEMASELLKTCTPLAREQAQHAPLITDLTGGLADVELDLAKLAQQAEPIADLSGAEESDGTAYIAALPASPARSSALEAPQWGDVPIDVSDMVVIVGTGELGPYGSARTRYEAEVHGELSAAGVLELAWATGLVRWESTPKPGWYDTETDDAVPEAQIFERYHDVVAERVGIRSYHDEGTMADHQAPLLASVYLEHDLSFAAANETEARAFLAADPANTVIEHRDGEWHVTRRAGSQVRVPRKLELTRTVGGQIPTGFDPRVWGISADMAESLDRVAVWNLVCTVDAFLSAGFTPAELMRWVHPARVANTQGTGMGGMQSMHALYVDTLLGEPKPNDLLQEALPNVIAAHVVQSYVGSYGAMIHPVAACATTAISVEEGVDKIKVGKADVVVAGGFDDLSVEGIVGFGDMSATADTEAMRAQGIPDHHFSRANDRRRAGFVESQGGGTILLARGDIARDMGLPVLGVVAYAGSFGDGVHTSIPAPGIGALAAGLGRERSPLAAALQSHGVTADDIAVISKHDTSTQANDPNESRLHENLQAALGRTAGNPLFVISQKTLTGHAKGGAAAFQLTGLCQVMSEGVLPPNRSLDCVDEVLAEHPNLVWLRESLPIGPVKAGIVTSLGFGHVSGLIVVAHPQAFIAALDETERDDFRDRAAARSIAGRMRITEGMYGGAALYQRPAGRRFGDDTDLEADVLLEPAARLGSDEVYRTP